MKITDSIKNASGLSVEKLEANASKKNAKAAEVSVGSSSSSTDENVTLSPLSSQMKTLEAKVAASEVFDTNKVDSIKSAIASGQFKVDSEKVADGLIQSVKDLINR